MKTLLELLGQLLPVMAFIPAGYFVKKKFDVNSDYVSKPLINVLLPLLVFFNMLDAEAEKLMILPVITFALALCMKYVAKFAHARFASKSDPLILSSSFSFFNIAFFGIPTVKALFGEDAVSVLICIYLGSALYGDTIGYFQVARTKLSFREALREVLSIPFLYVFIAGIIAKVLGLETPEFAKPILKVISFVVSAAGMMIVGFQLVNVRFKELDLAYFSKVLLFRTVAAMVIMAAVTYTAYLLADSLEDKDFQMLALVPLFPVAANVTVFAAFLKADEEQSSLMVFLSMMLSLVLVSIATFFF